jgi:hypothetical protein
LGFHTSFAFANAEARRFLLFEQVWRWFFSPPGCENDLPQMQAWGSCAQSMLKSTTEKGHRFYNGQDHRDKMGA